MCRRQVGLRVHVWDYSGCHSLLSRCPFQIWGPQSLRCQKCCLLTAHSWGHPQTLPMASMSYIIQNHAFSPRTVHTQWLVHVGSSPLWLNSVQLWRTIPAPTPTLGSAKAFVMVTVKYDFYFCAIFLPSFLHSFLRTLTRKLSCKSFSWVISWNTKPRTYPKLDLIFHTFPALAKSSATYRLSFIMCMLSLNISLNIHIPLLL